MTEQKKKLSKLCLAGFILTILTPLLIILVNWSDLDFLTNSVFYVILAIILLLPILGLILSIIGLVNVRRKGLKGKGFGITGIVLSGIYTFIAIIIAVFGGLFMWASSPHKTDKKLPTFYSDSEIVAVRYFNWDSGDYTFEELDEDRLDEFIDDLNSMELETGGMMGYYGGSDCGIEMELEDGTYLTYDGKHLALRNIRVDDTDSASSGYTHIELEAVYVTNCDFWEVMGDYFAAI